MSTPAPGVLVPRDAATVMLLRDGPDGVEVFMMRRTLNAAFVGGFYVFPGGAVDAADRAAEVEASCVGLTDADASEQLSIPSGGLAFWVAAVRECFEEAGVLLAAGADGTLVHFADDRSEHRFEAHRRAVHAGERRLIDICADEGLRLAVGDIEYVSHWITPVGEPRRFDTRFFVARAPIGQEPLHDDHETIASLWVRPADALARQVVGRAADDHAHDQSPRVPGAVRHDRGGDGRRRHHPAPADDRARAATEVRRRRGADAGRRRLRAGRPEHRWVTTSLLRR